MIETIRYSMNGQRKVLDAVLRQVRISGYVKDYPACSTLYTNVIAGTEEQRGLEENIQRHSLRANRISYFSPTPEELSSCELFSSEACRWTDDVHEVVDPPPYTGKDACPECGKGSLELSGLLTVDVAKLKDADLVRVPPGLVLGSARLVEMIREQSWTGLETRPIVELESGKESEVFRQLWLTSIMPPMHPTAPLRRSPIPDSCERCRRLGYELPEVTPVYGERVAAVAADWNLSLEWTAPHYVSCPELICRRRVVHALLKLEPSQVWLPVKLLP